MEQAVPFERQSLERALRQLGLRAHAEGKTIEIAIYGGSALILTYDWRIATREPMRCSRPIDKPCGAWRR